MHNSVREWANKFHIRLLQSSLKNESPVLWSLENKQTDYFLQEVTFQFEKAFINFITNY